MNPTIEEILKAHLASGGYDGFYNDDWECGCALDDLAPCGEPSLGLCRAGYKQFPCPSTVDFAIGKEKCIEVSDE